MHSGVVEQPRVQGTERSSWRERLRALFMPPLRSTTVLVLVGVFLFVALAQWRAGERSFHQDELTNLRMHALRARGEMSEPQHGAFHRFYAWWLKDNLGERHARLPATLFVAAGLLCLAGLGGRLAGPAGAVAALATGLFWPRAWDNALEMRYYSLIFLAALASLHALLSLWRGAVFRPWLILALATAPLAYWHPTPLPWHAGAFLIGFVLTLRNAWTSHRSGEASRAFLIAGLLALMVAAGIGLASMLRGYLQQLEDVEELGERFDGSVLLQASRWVTAWVDDHLATAFAPLRLLRVTFPLLLVAGAWSLWQRERWFLFLALALIASQWIGALATKFPIARLLIGYKYLGSSGTILLLLAALGVHWTWEQLRGRWGGMAAAGVLATFFFLPLAPRTLLSALGDGSNFRPLYHTLNRVAREEDAVPILFGRSETLQSVPIYRWLLPEFTVKQAQELYLSPAAFDWMLVRPAPVFLAVQPRSAARYGMLGLTETYHFYRSNFTPTWDIDLRVPAGTVVASGQSAAVAEGVRLAFPNPGEWIVPPGVAIEGGTVDEDGRLRITAPTLARVTAAPEGAVLQPDFSLPVVRPAAFAQGGPLEKLDRPFREVVDGRPIDGYQLSGQQEVEYSFDFPEAAVDVVLVLRPDLPVSAGVSVRVAGEFFGWYQAGAPDAGDGRQRIRFALPQEVRGRTATLSIGHVGENGYNKANTDEVTYLILEEVRIEPTVPGAASTTNLRGMLRRPRTAGLREGRLDFRAPGAEKAWQSTMPEGQEVPVTATPQGVRIGMPPVMQTHLIYLPSFPVTPRQSFGVQFTSRAINLERNNAVPVMVWFDANGNVLRQSVMSSAPIEEDETRWTTRTLLVTAREGAVLGAFGLFLNAPDGAYKRADAAIEIQELRFLGEAGP